MTRTTTVLIVGDDPARRSEWAGWLMREGYTTATCEGPNVVPCPWVDGRRCPLREAVDIAIVDMQRPGEVEPHAWPERFCTTLPDDGRTVFVCTEEMAGTRIRLNHPVSSPTLQRAISMARHPAGRSRSASCASEGV